MTTFAPITEVNKKDKVVLAWVLYIYYLLCFQKDNKYKLQTLINFGSKINAITPVYTAKLGF